MSRAEVAKKQTVELEEYPETIQLQETPHSQNHEQQSSLESFRPLVRLARELEPPPLESLEKKRVFLGKKTHKYSLMLDLDETLVACDCRSRSWSCPSLESASLKVRPHAYWLLEEMSKYYELFIFTAGEQSYGEKIRTILDPTGVLIRKVLSREHCVITSKGYYVKDLRIFADRRLCDILIVDNSILSFAFQLENGIPVTEYTGGEEEDTELLHLGTYLISLSEVDDLVGTNAKNIGLTSLQK